MVAKGIAATVFFGYVRNMGFFPLVRMTVLFLPTSVLTSSLFVKYEYTLLPRDNIMYQYNPLQCLPSSAELPDSDDTPVDSELQILIPNLLLAILSAIWQNRDDWYFGINMGVYYEPSKDAIV
jgi:hypothetical protein